MIFDSKIIVFVTKKTLMEVWQHIIIYLHTCLWVFKSVRAGLSNEACLLANLSPCQWIFSKNLSATLKIGAISTGTWKKKLHETTAFGSKTCSDKRAQTTEKNFFSDLWRSTCNIFFYNAVSKPLPVQYDIVM